MFFISAQPDELYFKWQLEVQLLNFSRNNISADKIHVLVSYNPDKGINPKFKELAEQQSERANFFFYEDLRITKNYVPASRPHIIKKHFAAHPYLKDNAIFYHDSDIIFRELPDFDTLCKDETWYISDARSYISADYINGISETILHEMCEILEIDKALILEKDKHAGGAQYILKGVNYQFWDKIEHDAEKLYTYLLDNKERYGELYARFTGKDIASYNPIQDWCADMWAILWNGHQMGYNVEIHKELDFCWPLESLDNWYATKILHNSGIIGREHPGYFYKSDHYSSEPYDVSFDHITKDRCTIKYVEAIIEYRESIKTDLTDVTFLIPLRIDSPDRLDNINIITTFLLKHFKTNILILEADDHSKINVSELPQGVKHIFIEDDQPFLHRTRYNNIMIKMATTSIAAIYDTDVLMEPDQVVAAVEAIRKKESVIVYPYNGHFLSVENSQLKSFFKSKMDINILKKHTTSCFSFKSFGGAVLVNREVYMECGMENENFNKWGPEDMERVRRMEILGYAYKRIEGPLFHLFHHRGPNSTFNSEEETDALMSEYIRICNMTRSGLENEIDTWKWKTVHS